MPNKIIEVIDDEEDLTELISELVEKHFKDVKVYTSDKCCSLDISPDILIIDYLMPGYNGFEQILRCIERKHFPRIIVWTAWQEEVLKDLSEVKKFNPNIVVVQKPDTSILINTIKQFLEDESLISICANCRNPIYWLDKIDPDIKICEACRDEK